MTKPTQRKKARSYTNQVEGPPQDSISTKASNNYVTCGVKLQLKQR